MTRYDPMDMDSGRPTPMQEHLEGDYVRYEVAQALYDALLSLTDSVGDRCKHANGVIDTEYQAARAALALAEKKDT